MYYLRPNLLLYNLQVDKVAVEALALVVVEKLFELRHLFFD